MDPELKTAIEDLGRGWAAFQEVHERRGAEDREQLAKINAALDENEKKLNRLQAFGLRGGGGDQPWHDTVEGKAYLKYLRLGRAEMDGDEVKALTLANDPTAGYLAPSEFVAEIIKGIRDVSPIRQIARVRPTSMRSTQHPKRTGTFSATRVSETGARTETTGLTYGLIEIAADEMYAQVHVGAQLLEDAAFDLEAELTMEFAEAFGALEGSEAVNGTGVGEMEGILVNADVGSTNSGAATTVTADGLLSAKYAIKTGYARSASWAMNRTTLGSIRKLKDGNGQYLWMPGLAMAAGPTIDGDPYVEFPDMPSEGAGLVPVLYGDFMRGYTMADRVVMSVLRDPYTQADAGKIVFHARRRVGARVTLAEALRKLTCAV